jgi:3-oxoadipate CoA-transferase, beta subunit
MDSTATNRRRLTREQIAKRVARELADGWVVNIGIGMPTLVVPHVPADREVIFHTENGIIGMGPRPATPEEEDPDLLDAGKRPVTLVVGGAYVHHADSFAVARGGRLDAAVLGAFQVAANGDLANWKLLGAKGGNVGGAMDIAVGARRVYVMMSHVTKDGEPKVVNALTYPLTAMGAVTKVFTDMAVISRTVEGLVLEETAPGLTAADVQAVTEPRLIVPDRVETIAA